MIPVKKSVTLDFKLVGAAATMFPFPESPYLRGKKITGLAISNNQTGIQTGLTNYLSYDTGIRYSFLTFVDTQGNQFIQNLPAVELVVTTLALITDAVPVNNRIIPNNQNGLFQFMPREIVWTKSYIFIPGTPGGANYCAQFSVFYQD